MKNAYAARTSQANQGLEQSKSAYRYRIGSGDVLNIMVWAHSDLNSPIQQSNPQTNQVSRGAWVDEGGYITYPLAGKIQAKGKTLDELQNILTNLLRRYIKNPQVAINVTEFRSQRVSVSGAINQAGQLPITNIPMTILDAINQAGGVTQSADTQHIKWTHNGVDRTISLQNMLQYGDMSQTTSSAMATSFTFLTAATTKSTSWAKSANKRPCRSATTAST